MKPPGPLKQEVLDNCTACGLCAAMCPPFSHRMVDDSDQETQDQVRNVLGGGPVTGAVIERSRLCDECYLCTIDTCPENLDPMRINQLLRGLLHLNGSAPRPFTPPSDVVSDERLIAALLTTEEEFGRITTPTTRGNGSTLFFAGCNVYYQPHLLLTALDVLERIWDDWTFLPGLDRCCGSNYDSAGRLAAGREAMDDLLQDIREANPRSIVVWCPTCLARFSRTGSDPAVISFARFVADRLEERLDKDLSGESVTLHEACKVGFLDIDASAPRDLLGRLSGKPVREMERHGKDTVCCGWSLHQSLPEIGKAHRERRLAEAAATGAGTLATVCHGCQWVLAAPDAGGSLRIANYVQLVGEVLGIEHMDRAKQMRGAGDADSVLETLRHVMGERLDHVPYSPQIIREVVTRVLADPHRAGP